MLPDSLATSLKNWLDVLRLRLLQSGVATWWATLLETLIGLLPRRWRSALVSQRTALGWLWQADALAVMQIQNGQAKCLDTLPNDAEAFASLHSRSRDAQTPRWLLWPAASILRRPLRLPLAAEARLNDVLGFEIDRQTPFSAEQVCFAGRVLSRDNAAKQVQVELLVLPRARLESALAALGPLSEGLSGVDVIDEHGACLGVNLLPLAQRERRSDPTRRRQFELLACAGILLLAALVMVLNNRQDALLSLRATVENANTDVRQVRALRNQLHASAAAANFLAQTRAAHPTMLELLADLTRRIPDDTSLDKLAVNDGKLVLVGLSKSPAALVGLLQDSPLLRSPGLAGAVQLDTRTGRERFTLTATVAAPKSAAAPAVNETASNDTAQNDKDVADGN